MPASGTEWLPILSGLVGGLALFLFALGELARSLQEAAGDRLRVWLTRATATPIRGFATGVAATVALDSSSATIVTLIALVDTGLIGWVKAVPVVLGSNLGTTASTQIMAAGLSDAAPFIFAGAIALRAVTPSPRAKRAVSIFAMIALLLFALELMSAAAKPLAEQQWVVDRLRTLHDPVTGMVVGAVVTIALQSSSATMALVLAVASAGLIPLEGALAVMLGAEIGTCADAVIAAVGRSAAALRVGLFHLGYNLAMALAGLVLITPLTELARWSASGIAGQIANAQIVFNLTGGLLFLLLLIPFKAKLSGTVVSAT